MNKNLLSSVFLLLTMISGLVIASTIPFGTAQTATSVSGIIFSDATWTKANSPINITGPTAIAKGVTVTIEPGTVVHFNVNTLEVNGTLRAIGTSTEPITLNGDYRGRMPVFGSSDYNGILGFSGESESWNAQTGTGCIIENVNVISLSIFIHNASVKVNNNVLSGSHAWGGLWVDGGDSIISNNKITGGSVGVSGGSPVLSNNTLIGEGIGVDGGSPSIIGNLLYSGIAGIRVTDDFDVGDVMIADNTIANGIGFSASGGNVTFEHNLVLRCSGGCSLSSEAKVIIQSNTIAFNQYGIQSPPPSAKIIYNNLENNTRNNLSWGYSSNFDATYNWWGTTDASAISQTIVDYKNDYHAGNVTFIPFLDAPNPQAPLVSSFVAPSSSPSPSPSPEPSPLPSENKTTTPSEPDHASTEDTPLLGLNEVEVAILIVVIVIVALLSVLVALRLKKKR